MKNKVLKIITKYYVYIVVAVISTALLLIAMALNGCMPFGDKFPMPGNGFYQDYTQFLNSVRQIKSKRFIEFLDYGVGLTFDNYGMKSYSLSFLILKPWLYPIYYYMPEGMYLPVFFSYYAFNYIISGPAFILFLTHRRSGIKIDPKNPVLIVLGLCYCLSTYTISFFIYYFRYMIYIPIIFLGIEKIVYDKSSRLYILVLAYYMSTDAYYAFIMCIFASFYFLVLEHENVKCFLKNSIRFAVSSICSAMLAMAFLIPYFIRTRYSPYGSSDEVKPSILNWFGNILCPISEFHAFNEGMITSSNNFIANIYCGLAVLILLPVFFTIKDIKLVQRVKILLFLILIYIGFDNEFINYIFHGFHYQWQVPNRFSCFFIFIILTCFCDVIIRIKDLSKMAIFISAIAVSCILVASYFVMNKQYGIEFNEYYFSFIFLTIYLIVILLYVLNILKTKLSAIILCILSLEIMASSVPCFMASLYNDDCAYEIQYAEDMQKLVDRHPDMQTPYVITERPGEQYNQNASYITGTHSLSFYTSSSYSQHFDLFYRWGMLFSKNITYYTTGSPLVDMMLHVKYHVVNVDKFVAESPYTPIDMENNLVLYENPYYLPLGVKIDENAIAEWNQLADSYRNYETAFDRDNHFANSLGAGDIYSKYRIKEGIRENESYYTVQEDAEGNAYYIFHLSDDISGTIYIQVAQALEYVDYVYPGENRDIYFYAPAAIKNGVFSDSEITIGVLQEDNMNKLYETLCCHEMEQTEFSSNEIKGSISDDEGGMYYFAMPALPGIKTYVDGKEVEYIQIMNGIGIRVERGDHVISFRYIPEGMVIGWQITIISALIMLIYCMIKKKSKMKPKDEKEQVQKL